MSRTERRARYVCSERSNGKGFAVQAAGQLVEGVADLFYRPRLSPRRALRTFKAEERLGPLTGQSGARLVDHFEAEGDPDEAGLPPFRG
jgi:hypothetical protein